MNLSRSLVKLFLNIRCPEYMQTASSMICVHVGWKRWWGQQHDYFLACVGSQLSGIHDDDDGVLKRLTIDVSVFSKVRIEICGGEEEWLSSSQRRGGAE